MSGRFWPGATPTQSTAYGMVTGLAGSQSTSTQYSNALLPSTTVNVGGSVSADGRDDEYFAPRPPHSLPSQNAPPNFYAERSQMINASGGGSAAGMGSWGSYGSGASIPGLDIVGGSTVSCGICRMDFADQKVNKVIFI